MTATPSAAGVYAERLDAQFAGLMRLLGGATAAELERRPPSGAWCAREHLAHLARYHDVFLERLARMRSAPGGEPPRFARYRAEEDPDFPPWLALPADAVRSRLAERRTTLAAAVGALPDADLARVGVHPAFGPMPLALWLEFFLAHEGHHVYVAFRELGRSA